MKSIKRGFLLSLILCMVFFVAITAWAGDIPKIKFRNIKYDNVADWQGILGANGDLFNGQAAELQKIYGRVIIIPKAACITVEFRKMPILPSEITDADGNHLGTLFGSYVVALVTQVHRATGSTSTIYVNMPYGWTWWGQWPGVTPDPFTSYYVGPVLPKKNKKISVSHRLKGYTYLVKTGENPPAGVNTWTEVLGVLVLGLVDDLNGQSYSDVTIIAASPAPTIPKVEE